MRINQNPAAQPAESGRARTQSAASDDARASASSPFGADEAQLSGTHVQVQALAAQATQLPEIRQEKVTALRQVVLGGSYQPGAEQVATALFEHMAGLRAA